MVTGEIKRQHALAGLKNQTPRLAGEIWNGSIVSL
jgi:hypothetical protein